MGKILKETGNETWTLTVRPDCPVSLNTPNLEGYATIDPFTHQSENGTQVGKATISRVLNEIQWIARWDRMTIRST